MQMSDFSFEVPERLIAQYPLANRSASRLLVLDGASEAMQHARFSELEQFLRAGDLLVLNDTRVIPARLFGSKLSGGKIEVMLERMLGDGRMLARIRASKAPRAGTEIRLGDSIASIEGRAGEFFIIVFPEHTDIENMLTQHGHIPLPPYIQRAADPADAERYQTIYSTNPGAVAAPTAGLHFDQQLFDRLELQGVDTATITLHVGAGTFQPVRVQNPEEHEMHAELVEVTQATVDKINRTREQGGRIVAVGTTSVRSLESAAASGQLRAFRGETRLFITPGSGFRVVDAMITNFHLPESTLLMLVAAFAGHRQIMRAYAEAIEHSYRFYSYGDAMLLWPDKSSWQYMSSC